MVQEPRLTRPLSSPIFHPPALAAKVLGRKSWLGASQLSRLRADSIVSHNLMVTAGSVLAGALGFAFQSVVSHRLDPAEYGAVFAIITLITVIGLPGSALTLLMAREASRDRAIGHYAASAALLRDGNRLLLLSGC